MTKAPAAVHWTPRLADRQPGATRTSWDDAYQDLAALLRERRPLHADTAR